MLQKHEEFMRVALEEAVKGATEGNVAVGSVIVRASTVVARGRNLEISTGDLTAHAEIVAIREVSQASRQMQMDLSDCTLYTTIEPCPMCCGAVMVSGISTLVIGARHHPAEFDSHRLGAYTVERLIDLAGWKRLQVVTDVLGQECIGVRREWEARRKRDTGAG
jgi:tRNA(adenine34) deaminase